MLPSPSGRILAAGALAVVFVFVGLFLLVPVGRDERGDGQLVPADAAVIRASREGTLVWSAAVGTAVEAGELVATVDGGASRSELAATRARARASLVDYLRFPHEDRFAAAVPDTIRQLRAEQARAEAGALYSAVAGEVLLGALRTGDAVRAGDLIAVVGHREAPLELRASFPADAKPAPHAGDTVRFRWGGRAEQSASFEVTTVSYMATDPAAVAGSAPKPAGIQLVGIATPEHAERLRPGLRGEVELVGGTETMAELVWSNLAGALDLEEAR